jgi:AmmeMemoRadiSam system protein B
MMQHKKIIIFIVSHFLCDIAVGKVYKCHLSDAWYPSRAKSLTRKLDALAGDTKSAALPENLKKNIKAIVVAHAGYNYSGAVVSSVYQNILPDSFNRVVIIAPSHHAAFDGIGLPGIEYLAYKSPLGKISLDCKIIEKLQKKSSLFVRNHHGHELEHAIEVQIPFIQKYCRRCKIVPMLVGSIDDAQADKVAEMLLQLCDKKTLFVISCDLTRYQSSLCASGTMLQIGQGDLQAFQTLFNQSVDSAVEKKSLMILWSMLQKNYFGDVRGFVFGCSSPYIGMVIV